MWLVQRDCTILATLQYEDVRWKGRKTGVIYSSGKTSGQYASLARTAFKKGREWEGFAVDMTPDVEFDEEFKTLELENSIINKSKLTAEGFSKEYPTKKEITRYIEAYGFERTHKQASQVHFCKGIQMFQWHCNLKPINN